MEYTDISLYPRLREQVEMPENYAFVDLREKYDEVLLTRFYNEMMVPNFPLTDELDSLEYMKSMVLLSNEEDSAYKEPHYIDYHIVVMLRFDGLYDPSESYDFSGGNFRGELMGGVVFEYYIQANTGLLTYLLVNPKWRGLNLGQLLSDKCISMLEAHAKSRGHLAGCNAIFLETNSATRKDLVDVMEPAKRHEIFYKMGLRLVDFDYVQAPLDKDKRKVNYLLLCCFITPRIPSIRVGNKEQYYLPSTLLRNTVHAFWSNAPHKGRKFFEDVDYKRMHDQLRRRERIVLLDLPWERPFTIVDLWEHFDLELLVQFYQDFLVPCYQDRQEELDSLDSWLELLSPNQIARNDSDVVFHLLLALKYSADEEENSKPMISGGLSFEYFPNNNCGFLTYLLVPIGERGERMTRALLDRAISDLDNDAKTHGQLGGCNVIFMECSQVGSSQNSSLGLEIQDVEEQHPMLESMGWKMVDFDYVQPPNNNPDKKVKSMLLVALVTPKIPMLLQEGVKHLYIPNSTLKKFTVDLWMYSCQRLNYDFWKDRDFLNMLDQIERRPRIPLLSRPWSKPWAIIDMQENYDWALLEQFYDEILVPALRMRPNDLEPLEMWKGKLLESSNSVEMFHVFLAAEHAINDARGSSILGGLVFSYFEGTNCGFISHAFIKDISCKEMVAKSLMERAVGILDQDALTRGHLAGCNAIFLETLDPNYLGSELSLTDGVRPVEMALPFVSNVEQSKLDVSAHHGLNVDRSKLDISVQHSLLYKLGWRLVDFNYVAPPLKGTRKPCLMKALAMFLTDRVPKAVVVSEDDAYHYLPRQILTSFVKEYWRRSIDQSYDFTKDAHFLTMIDLTNRRERIPLLELPWERPWTLVDLWEDFDAQLLYKFYQTYASIFKNKSSRQPLSTWLQQLSEEDRDTPTVEDFHVILALNYPVFSSPVSHHLMKPSTATILGGLLFTYYTINSCGLLTFMTSPPNHDLLARNLIDEATVNLNENALLRGHIAGCNAIFMENPITDLEEYCRPNHETLYRSGWRLLNFEYYRPPMSIFSAGGTAFFLLVLLTPNIPKEKLFNGSYSYYLPKEMLLSFLWQHWRSAYYKIGKTMVTKDQCYQRMVKSLENFETVVLQDLPWKIPIIRSKF